MMRLLLIPFALYHFAAYLIAIATGKVRFSADEGHT